MSASMAIKTSPDSETMANKPKDDADVEARTVFIRNLPYTLTDSQLQEVFSEIGPVRRSFTVKEKGAEQHRGFGFVQFAVVEDAIRSVEAKDGTDLHGRRIMVQLAKRRPSFEQRRPKKQPNGEIVKGGLASSGTTNLEEENPQKVTSASSKTKKRNRNDTKASGKEKVAVESQNGKIVKGGLASLGTTNLEEEIPEKVRSASSKTKKRNRNDTKASGKEEEVAAESQRKSTCRFDVSDLVEDKRKRKKAVVPGEEKSSEKQRVARTVILGGLVSPEMREEVIDCAKKVGSVESVQSSLSPQELKSRGLEKDGCKMGAAAVVYTSVKAASRAVASLHQKTIGGGIVWARQLGGEGSRPRKWRVIIRNLPFKVTEKKIQELFSSVGFVWEVKIPRKPDGQAKGFAFASFTSKANTEKAIRVANGKTVENRPVAVDWAVERSVYEPTTDAAVGPEDDSKTLPSDVEDEDTASEGEEDDYIEEIGCTEEGLEKGGDDGEPAIFEEIDMAKKVLNKVVSASLDGEPTNNEPNQTDGDLHRSKGRLASVKEESKPQLKKKPGEGDQSTSRGDLEKTVFIKNLPFDAGSDDIKKHFLVFGKVKSVYLVLHPKTKRPKGTAFLEFSKVESAEAALSAAVGATTDGKFVGGIVFGGRQLEVLKAMGKKSAKAIAQEKLEHANVDRRNLYLTKEGKIEEGSAAANGVSEEDMQKRRQLEQVKATKLRSPNFHVSMTRLAVYNVPKSLNEAELRKLFIDAVKSRATKQHAVIKQVKILKDEANGEKSRGVAFVEFSEHQHALVALRVLNNNPETFGPGRRPIVGFAIENLQTLKKRQQRQLEVVNKSIDHEGSIKSQKGPRRKDEKSSKVSKNKGCDDEKQVLMDETKQQRRSDAEGLPGPSNKDKNAKLDRRNKSERSVAGHEKTELAGKKRKRHANTILNSTDGDPTKKCFLLKRSKKQKLSWESLESKEMINSLNDSFQGEKKKARLKKRTDSFNLNTNGARSLDNTRKEAFGTDNQLKAQKTTQRKKGSKLEIADKLDKLVAEYREKYFSDVSGVSKGNIKSTNVKASSDLKRWFE